jgi:predicted negative regulator of RcsB-dependent stress response
VEIYQTEEQQVDAIKDFWKENGNYIIAGLVIGFAGFIGFNYYKDNQLAQEEATSNAYQQVIELSDKNPKAFTEAADKFITNNKTTSYASLTAFALAKEAASHKDWEQVAKHLTIALSTAPNEGIKAIATVRLARVQIQLEQVEQALKTLSAKLPGSFVATVEEIKGDAYLKQEKSTLARNAYQAAIDAGGLTTSPALQMKLDDLSETVNLSSVVK